MDVLREHWLEHQHEFEDKFVAEWFRGKLYASRKTRSFFGTSQKETATCC